MFQRNSTLSLSIQRRTLWGSARGERSWDSKQIAVPLGEHTEYPDPIYLQRATEGFGTRPAPSSKLSSSRHWKYSFGKLQGYPGSYSGARTARYVRRSVHEKCIPAIKCIE